MSDQDIDTAEYSEEQEEEQQSQDVEAGEQPETQGEEGEKEAGGDDAGSDYVETDDPKILHRFGHLTRKASEAEKRYLQERREREKLEKQLEERESKQEPLKEVAAPDPDLALDDPEKFKQQQKQYVEFIREAERREIQGQQSKEQSKAENERKLQERVTSYVARAKELGVEQEKLQEAGTSIEPLMSEDLRDTLLEDEDGPKLTVYLHENVSDLSALIEASKQSPYKAGQVLERVRSKLSTGKKPKSSAPPPPTKVKGSRSTGSAEDGTVYE